MTPSTAFIIDIAIKSLIITTIASLLIPTLLRKSSAAARHCAWFLTTLALLILPLASLHLPALPVLPHNTYPTSITTPQPPTPASTTSPAPSLPPITQPSISPIDHATINTTPIPTTPPITSPQPTTKPSPPSLTTSQLILIITSAPIFLLTLTIPLAIFRLKILKKRAKLATDETLLNLLDEQCTTLNITPHINLFQSDTATMPMTFGYLTSRSANILLPTDATHWPASRTRSVLLHELAHIKRHDCLTQLIAFIACCLYWFNPLVWFAAHRMNIERERACDDLVLTQTTNNIKPSDYAQLILDIATNSTSPSALSFLTSGGGGGGISMANKNTFEKRILAILDPKRIRTTLTKPKTLLITLLLLSLTLPTAMLTAASSSKSTNKPATLGTWYCQSLPTTHLNVIQQVHPSLNNNDNLGLCITLNKNNTGQINIFDTNSTNNLLQHTPITWEANNSKYTITSTQSDLIPTLSNIKNHNSRARDFLAFKKQTAIMAGDVLFFQSNRLTFSPNKPKSKAQTTKSTNTNRTTTPIPTPSDVTDVTDITATKITLDKDKKQTYILMDQADASEATHSQPRPLLIILPGGDGSEDFHFFCRRLYKFAALQANPNFIAVQPIAPKWSKMQTDSVTWPNKYHKFRGMKFSTETLINNIIKDVKANHKIDTNQIFTLAWSSGGPAAYDLALQKDSPITGSLIAMSVFKPKPQQLRYAKNKNFFIYHSKSDRVVPYNFSTKALNTLTNAKANVMRKTYDGNHGWFHPNNYDNITQGLNFLEQHLPSRPVKPTSATHSSSSATHTYPRNTTNNITPISTSNSFSNTELDMTAVPGFSGTPKSTSSQPTTKYDTSHFIGSWHTKAMLGNSLNGYHSIHVNADKTWSYQAVSTGSTPSDIISVNSRLKSGQWSATSNDTIDLYRTRAKTESLIFQHDKSKTGKGSVKLGNLTFYPDRPTTYTTKLPESQVDSSANLPISPRNNPQPTTKSIKSEILGKWYSKSYTQQQFSKIANFTFDNETHPVSDPFTLCFQFNEDRTTSITFHDPTGQREDVFHIIGTWEFDTQNKINIKTSDGIDDSVTIVNDKLIVGGSPSFTFSRNKPKSTTKSIKPEILGNWYSQPYPANTINDILANDNQLPDQYKFAAFHFIANDDQSASLNVYDPNTGNDIQPMGYGNWKFDNNKLIITINGYEEKCTIQNNIITFDDDNSLNIQFSRNKPKPTTTQQSDFLGDWYALQIPMEMNTHIRANKQSMLAEPAFGFHCKLNPDNSGSLYFCNSQSLEPIQLLDQITWSRNTDDNSITIQHPYKGALGMLDPSRNTLYLDSEGIHLYRLDHPSNKRSVKTDPLLDTAQPQLQTLNTQSNAQDIINTLNAITQLSYSIDQADTCSHTTITIFQNHFKKLEQLTKNTPYQAIIESYQSNITPVLATLDSELKNALPQHGIPIPEVNLLLSLTSADANDLIIKQIQTIHSKSQLPATFTPDPNAKPDINYAYSQTDGIMKAAQALQDQFKDYDSEIIEYTTVLPQLDRFQKQFNSWLNTIPYIENSATGIPITYAQEPYLSLIQCRSLLIENKRFDASSIYLQTFITVLDSLERKIENEYLAQQ